MEPVTLPQPNIESLYPPLPLSLNPISFNAITSGLSEKVEIFGVAAFLELGLKREGVKYAIQNERLVATNVFKVLNIDVSAGYRTLTGASSADLNFLDEEIPKFIRWYIWNKETQEEACLLLKNVLEPGLESLKAAYPGDEKKEVRDRIDYWIQLIKFAVAEPVSKETFLSHLRTLFEDKSSLGDKIVVTYNYAICVDLSFGLVVKSLIDKERLKKINAIFKKQASTERDQEIEKYMENLYGHFERQKKMATRQTIPCGEWVQLHASQFVMNPK